MLDTGSGGGGTPWESMTLDLMQRLIQNPDIDAQWHLVEAWNKSTQLLGDHLWQIRDYRNNLASVWSPQKSPAAAAYLGRLDELIENLTETYEASIANHRAFSAVTSSIDQAQAQMQKIYQQYQISKTAQSSSTPTAQAHQEALRLQAVKLLGSVSTDLAVAQSHIVKPTAYIQYRKKGKDSTPVADYGEFTAPPLPRITPSVPSDRHASESTHAPLPPVDSTPGVDTSQPGLVLGGITQPLPQSTTPGISPINPAVPGSTGGEVVSPVFIPPSTGLLPDGERPVPTAPGGRVTRGAIVAPGGLPEKDMRAAPSGVIGGMPGYGGGRQGSGRTGVRRANPVGGVIGNRDRPLAWAIHGDHQLVGPAGV
jgi:hypothetical protein